MDYATQILWYALLGFVALWIIISAAGALPIWMLAKVTLAKVEGDSARKWLQEVFRQGLVEPQWLADNNFEPQGVYLAPHQIGNPHFVVWRRAGERSYVCVYIITQNRQHRAEIDLVTAFELGGLTTGTTKDSFTIPGRPGHWMQAFPERQVAPLWKLHDDALTFLKQTTGQRASTEVIDFADDFVSNVRAHIAYVRTIPLWFLRIPYWYFVRRNRLFKLPIHEQYDLYGTAAASMESDPPVKMK
jgi:hypothetical protein